jgi:hypothetical protein
VRKREYTPPDRGIMRDQYFISTDRSGQRFFVRAVGDKYLCSCRTGDNCEHVKAIKIRFRIGARNNLDGTKK